MSLKSLFFGGLIASMSYLILDEGRQTLQERGRNELNQEKDEERKESFLSYQVLIPGGYRNI
jgi:hypothetical protein